MSGDFKIIHELTSQQGYNPSQILQASDGNLWGLTPIAGGTFFRIRLDGLLLDTGLFDCNRMGCLGAQMIQASDGNFYGVAGAGGFTTRIRSRWAQSSNFRLDFRDRNNWDIRR